MPDFWFDNNHISDEGDSSHSKYIKKHCFGKQSKGSIPTMYKINLQNDTVGTQNSVLCVWLIQNSNKS